MAQNNQKRNQIGVITTTKFGNNIKKGYFCADIQTLTNKKHSNMKHKHIILVTALALFCFIAEKANAQYWILPKAANGTSTAWSYLEASLDDGLTAGYESATFDYSSWAIGQSGFGINAYKKDWYGTIYSGAQGLWIRKKVTLDVQDLSSLTFELIYDEDPVIYINGTEVYRATGWHDGSYKDITATINKTTLNLQGDNEIAIHFVPGGGGSCLDFSIYCAEEPPTLDAYITDALASLATITPANHHDNTGTRSFLLGNERTSVDGLATSIDDLANLQAALDVIEAARDAGKTKSQVPDELAALAAAKAKVDAKSNPLVDGYYYLVAEYDAGTDGIPGGFVIGSNGDGIAKVEYNSTNPMQMFKVEYDAANGKVCLQNVATEKWLGVVDGSAWKQSDTKVALNIMSGKDHNWYWGSPKNDAARSCSFILSNDEGKGISSSNCSVASDVTNTSSQAWLISWAFRPADEAYNAYLAEKDFNDLMAAADEALTTVTPADHHDNTGTRSFLLGNEKTSIDGLATSKDAKDALQAARDAVYNGYKNDGKTLDQLSTEIATLNAAITTVNAKSNPLVDGYYYVVAEVDADADGVPGGWVMRYSGSDKKIGRAHYDANDTKQIFKVTYDAANGKITLQNAASGLYVGVVDGNQWYFTSEATTLNVKTGSPFYWARSAETTKAARSCSFVLYNDNNKCIDNAVENSTTYGDASYEGTWGWRISWAFRPAPETVVNNTTQILNINNGVATSTTNDPVTLSEIQAALSNDDYEYTTIDLSGITLASGITAAEIAALQTGNTLVYLPSSASFTGVNMVKDGVCSQLVLTDGLPFSAPTAFTATNATYNRTMSNEWGTICLPYEVSGDANTKYYTITSIENNALVVSEVATLAAGTPALVQKVSGDAVTGTATNAPVSATVNNTTGTVNMYGTYERTQVTDANAYYIKDNKFWQCNNYFYCNPFRAYFTTGSTPSNAFDILIADDDVTAIASAVNGTSEAVAIYSVDGIKLGKLQKGVNIIKLANGKTQKVVVK